jgi:hypothetical protein
MTTPRLHASWLCFVVGWGVLWFAGCGDVVAQPILDTTDGAADVGPSPDAPGPFESGRLQDASAYCQGHGPPIQLASDGGGRCTGDLSHIFRFALCACQSLDASGRLSTDSLNFDSASIASNGAVLTNGHTTIGGAIYAAGQNASPAVTLRGDGSVYGVQAGGDVHVGGPYTVSGDVDTSGNVILDPPGGSLSVTGHVILPAGNSAAMVSAAGGILNKPVTVPPPCDCSNPIDVASIVSAHQSDNDDAMYGLSSSSLVNPTAPVTLPCGRYYVNGIQGGMVTLEVMGHVALFVQGDMSIGGLKIDLSPGAELDLFVSGDVLLMGTMTTFGAPSSPGQFRLYVGGTSFQLVGSATTGVNAYAPHATVSLASALQMSGALFASAFQFSGDFAIHYDSSVLAAAGCAPSGGACTTCDDCPGGMACKSGTCAACLTTADCCAPLMCNAGRCVLSAL